jgi:hypothetical protein
VSQLELLLLVLLDSAKNSMSGDFSSLELAHFLENRRIGFRSIVHLNRYLFDQHFPSYDKTVNLLK